MYQNSLLLGNLIAGSGQPPTQDPAPQPAGPQPPLIANQQAMTGLVGDPENPMAKEMRLGYKNVLPYDNKSVGDLVRSAATKTGINPSMLLSSAWQEGLNVMANPKAREKREKQIAEFRKEGYPVDGYEYYGLDTFGDKADALVKKGYLPADFANQYTKVPLYNDHTKKVDGKTVAAPQAINSASFKTNEAALMAKAAMMRDTSDRVKEMAKKKGITLDDSANNYFTLVGYNAGEGNADKMMDDFAKAKDKKSWLKNGSPNWQKIHRNISPRLANMSVADELLNAK